ncbi:glycosyltransferase [Actinomadura sp. HBU206391]|uniref:glycosyltransferase n=1 Tax=Actinomadura sp. HBU206391 TaxID=2731692 RepID=UPI00164EFED7|nr:glycosyltransferase [Actinomadura sp. HBU206391]MBC6456838.1 glycosyltransferase [Actinomadura sp. HBU206391]
MVRGRETAVVMTCPRSGDGRLTIVLAVGSLRLGGTEHQVVKLAVGLRDRGHDVHVIALRFGGPLRPALEAAGVPVRVFAYNGLRQRDDAGRLSPRGSLAHVSRLLAVWRYFRGLRPDVCHAFLFGCYTRVLPLAWAARVPVRVNGRRGATPPSPLGVRRKILDFLGSRASSLYVCNSRAGADELVRLERVPARRVVVISNGVDVPAAVADVERQPPRGIVVANLIHYKGHADLVDALAMLDGPPGVTLVGEGPERDALTRLVGLRRLTDTVRFTGAVPDARPLFLTHQFAVLPSHQEGLPNAVLEAMAAGLPVITTAVGGIPEIVTDGVTGLLVPPRDPRSLADMIELLAADPGLRVRLGTAARRAAEGFGVPRCAERHEAAYRAHRW